MNDKEIKVGEYIRTKDGIIAKVTYVDCMMIDCDRNVFDLEHLAMMEIPTEYKEEYIKKHSSNIIDLIEVGDYVNGYLIYSIEKFKDGSISFNDEPTNFCGIKSIVTKEQFANLEYRLED